MPSGISVLLPFVPLPHTTAWERLFTCLLSFCELSFDVLSFLFLEIGLLILSVAMELSVN